MTLEEKYTSLACFLAIKEMEITDTVFIFVVSAHLSLSQRNRYNLCTKIRQIGSCVMLLYGVYEIRLNEILNTISKPLPWHFKSLDNLSKSVKKHKP